MLKKRLLIIFIGLISLSILEFQYFNQAFHTPKDSIYLGTVHYPPDYFSYLSYMVQGKDHLLSSTILYTSEKTPLVLVRWQYVLWGKLLSFFPLNTGQMYQIAVVIFTIGFMVSGYKLISLLLEKYEERILAFVFFVSSTAWPLVKIVDGRLSFSYHYYWFNTGNFFTRFSPTPNHLLGSILLTSGFILVLRWCKKIHTIRKIPYLLYNFAFVFIGLTLASISPMHWILFLGSLTGLMVILALRDLIIAKKTFFSITNFAVVIARTPTLRRGTWQSDERFPRSPALCGIARNDRGAKLESILKYLQPILFSIAGGLPAILYMLSVSKVFPYNSGISWEATKQVFMDFPNLFFASGIVILFASLGCYSYFRHKFFNPERLVTLFFLTISLAFFFTDLPWQLGTSNVRYWPEGIYVFIAVLASYGVFFLARLAKKAKYFVLTIILLLYLGTTIPTFIAEFNEKSEIIISNIYYLPNTIYDIYQFASRTIKRPSVFLLPWPYDFSFPAFTGQKSFTGHPLSHMTIDADKKYTLSAQFFSGTLDEKKVQEDLKRNGIQYILTPNKSVIEKYSFLKNLYSRGDAAVFEVR